MPPTPTRCWSSTLHLAVANPIPSSWTASHPRRKVDEETEKPVGANEHDIDCPHCGGPIRVHIDLIDPPAKDRRLMFATAEDMAELKRGN